MKLIVPFVLLSSLPLAAQHPILKVVGVGDPTPIGAVTSIDNLALGDGGAWYVECDTNHAATTADGVLLSSAGIVQREGDPVTLSGATLASFDGLSVPGIGSRAQNLFLDGTAGTNDDSGVFWNGQLTLQEGTLSQAPQFSAGTPYIGFFEVKANVNQKVLVMASVDDPAIATSVDRALVVFSVDANGALLSESVLHKEGDLLPGQVETIADFGTGPHNFAFNASGSVLFVADLNGPTTSDGVVYRDGTLIAQEGSPSPVAGRNWAALGSARVAMNSSGQWVHTGTLDGSTASDLVIVTSSGKLAQEGDPVPGMPQFAFTGFGSGAVLIADNGDVFWYAEWNGPASSNAAWFHNSTPIVVEGVDMSNNQLITGLSAVQDNASLAPSDNRLLFEATLQGSGSAALLADGAPQPVTYCTAKTNSLGCVPQIGWSGFASASQPSGFDVFSTDTLNNKNGLLFYGVNGPGALPFQGGTLCVASPIRRTPAVNSFGNPPPNDCSGVFLIDMNAFAQGLGGGQPLPALTVPGTVVHCQWWGRDPGYAPPNGTTLSDGLRYVVGF